MSDAARRITLGEAQGAIEGLRAIGHIMAADYFAIMWAEIEASRAPLTPEAVEAWLRDLLGPAASSTGSASVLMSGDGAWAIEDEFTRADWKPTLAEAIAAMKGEG